jgi:hypothetical protein
MVTKVIKQANPAGGSGVDFSSTQQIVDYINSLDLLALDQDVAIEYTGSMQMPSYVSWGPLTSDDTHKVTHRPAAGQNVNVLFPNTLDYGGAAAEIQFIHGRAQTIKPGQVYENLQLYVFHIGEGDGAVTSGTNPSISDYDVIIRNCRIKDVAATTYNSFLLGNNDNRTYVHDCLGITEGGQHVIFAQQSDAKVERSTFAARGAGLGAPSAAIVASAVSCVAIGFGPAAFGEVPSQHCFANTAQNDTNITVNTAIGALVINESNDFRPAANGPLIGAADASAKGSKDILGNNRGQVPDAGALQLNPAPPSPVAVVTSSIVSGQTVTISGTVTGSTNPALASLTPKSVVYNESAVAQNNVAVTVNGGTFTVEFDNVHVGQYLSTLTFSNTGGAADATGITTVVVPGATGTLTSQPPPDGSGVSISGTTSGNPNSGTCIIPADTSTPNGAVDQGPFAVTLGSGTFSVAVQLPPGNYSAPVIRFTTAYGTGLPVSGTQAISIAGISGNPQADQPVGTILVGAAALQGNASSVGIISASQRSATITLVGRSGVGVGALSGLKWAWFDQATPDLFGAPVDKGSVESTDASGVLTVDLPHSTLLPGGTGWLVVTDSNGSAAAVHKAFSGPVVVN